MTPAALFRSFLPRPHVSALAGLVTLLLLASSHAARAISAY